MPELPSVFRKEIFAVDGVKITVGVLILLAVLYWFLFLRSK